MVARSQVFGDQLVMLARGWQLAFRGELVPFGNPTSAGGFAPGAMTSLTTGLPLLAWADPRAPTLLILGLHVLVYWLLDGVVKELLGTTGRRVFAILYWLNPWRFFHSAFLWNANFLPPLAALHFVSVYRQRRRPAFWWSFLHVAAIGVALQLHAPGIMLAAISAVLLWRGYFRFELRGGLTAAALVAASLAPWALSLGAGPAALPDSLIGGRSLVTPPLNIVRGALYWLRLPTFLVSGTARCFDFTSALGPEAATAARRLAEGAVHVVGMAGLLVTAWWNTCFWMRRWRRPSIREPRRGLAWLRGVLAWSLIAALLTFAISPTTLMSWQAHSLFSLAVLLATWQATLLWRSRRRVGVRRLAAVYGVLSLTLGVALAFGSPHYRPGGANCGSGNAILPAMRYDHPMFDDLGLRRFDLRVNDPDGWWLPGLEEPVAPPEPRTE